MDADVQVKLALYAHFAETGRRPSPGDIASRTALAEAEVLAAYRLLQGQRLLVLEPDGATIRMAPPFSGVPTQHRVEIDGVEYHANCAWDAFGIPAALHRPARVLSRCEQSGAPLTLAIQASGPEPSEWLFHCLVPAAHWWDDLVFT